MTEEDGMMAIVVDDVSRYGLRRVHAVTSRRLKEVVMRRLRDRIAKEDGRWEFLQVLVHTDESGSCHVRMFWRWTMGPLWVVARNGLEVGAATRKAAEGFFRKRGRFPNRAVIRKGTEVVGKGITLVNAEGVKLGEVWYEEVGWIRSGDVGVYWCEGV